ncbi:MAG TPA: glycosyltransferase family 39 protein [Gemmatimonadales bacterium]|nr:glycosyltransferase family 39 protein [Gemmatimonadales bacterium]
MEHRAPPAFRTALPLLGLMLFALVVHLPARLGVLYGEPDAARLANSALLWTRAGVRSEALSQYLYYTSPGYIWLITRLLPGTLGSPAPAASALNLINLLVAVFVPVPLFLLFRRLAGDSAALIGTLLLTVVPAFWQGGLYGFPTLPAVLFMVLATWWFDRWLMDAGGDRGRAAAIMGCLLCLTAAILLKADVYLSAVALWGLLLYRGRWSVRTVVLLAVMEAVPIAVLYLVARGLLQSSPGALAYATSWTRKFPAQSGPAFTREHAQQLLKSFGLLTLPAFVVALVWLVRTGRYALAATLVVWAALPVAFWFVRPGDSARHHFQSTVPVALGVGIVLARLRAPWRYAALLLLVVVNYWAFRPTGSTVTTSGNLLRSAALTARAVALDQRLAREFAERAEPRAAFIGSFTEPYAEDQVLSLADSVTGVKPVVRFAIDAEEISYVRHGQARVAVMIELPSWLSAGRGSAEIAEAYRNAGYAVYSTELYGDMGRRRLSRRDFRLSELPARN